MSLTRVLLLLVTCLTTTISVSAAPVFSKVTTIDGVTIYQDSLDPQQFWYIPANVPLVLGENLQDFNVTYWGIGLRYAYDGPDGIQKSSVGAVLSGKASIDITAYQRTEAMQEILRAFGVANPRLSPIPLKNVSVTPTLAKNTMAIDKGDMIFPTDVAFGSSFNYLVGTGEQTFAEYVATETTAPAIVANPAIGLNIIGDAEFQGDPWTISCHVNVSDYWHKVVSDVNVSGHVGWFNLGSADYNNVVQDLTKSMKSDCQQTEGSLDTEKYGRQVFEYVKELMESIDKDALNGEGLFKFAPDPEPKPAGSQGGGLFPWSVSVNASYSSVTSFQQATVDLSRSYTGRFLMSVPASITLAVECNAATAGHFVELQNPSEPCIDAAKADRFTKRLEAENSQKVAILKQLYDQYFAGQITLQVYIADINLVNATSFEDSHSQTLTKKLRGGPTSLSISVGASPEALLNSLRKQNGGNQKR